MNHCNHKCVFCWRDLTYTSARKITKPDKPKEILDNLIKEHIKYLQGFGGNKKAKNFKEALKPKHVALSLAGETCLYPYLPELIKEIHKRKLTSFVVSNGTIPEMIEKLTKTQPTQLYITLPTPDKKTYEKVCNPSNKKLWKNILKSLKIFAKHPRSTIRLTLGKNLNMHNPERYSEIINSSEPKFVELKAFMPVGYARHRTNYSQMPTHQEIKNFGKQIEKNTKYKIVDEKIESRVVLLMKDKNNQKLP